MSIPTDLLYSETHEWVRVEGNEAVIGITDHAQSALGDITYVELPAVDAELAAGDEMGVVESVKAASDLYIPVSGKVIAVNTDLDEQPGYVNVDPYGKGWMIRVAVSAVPAGLLKADAYEQVCKD